MIFLKKNKIVNSTILFSFQVANTERKKRKENKAQGYACTAFCHQFSLRIYKSFTYTDEYLSKEAGWLFVLNTDKLACDVWARTMTECQRQGTHHILLLPPLHS